MKTLFILVLAAFQFNAFAAFQENLLDELDPRSPDIEERLQEFDEAYFKMTGKSPFINKEEDQKGICYRNACPVWARVNLSEQLFYLYIDGELKYVWLTSTGKRGYRTPYLDQNPNGRIYDRYTSSAYPGGDYNGLGNMPYAVFVRGGYAIHGTVKSNWPKLGTPASKGCIRLHPDNGYIFNRLVRASGVGLVWVSVE
jgi:lipoprotein-anchoring transpeptidase ErfK/SrfK